MQLWALGLTLLALLLTRFVPSGNLPVSTLGKDNRRERGEQLEST